MPLKNGGKMTFFTERKIETERDRERQRQRHTDRQRKRDRKSPFPSLETTIFCMKPRR
jgi:hypothetical protein